MALEITATTLAWTLRRARRPHMDPARPRTWVRL